MKTDVLAIIKDNDNNVLVLYHNKLKCWTIPVGIVEDEPCEQTLVRELSEELDIIPTSYSLIKSYKQTFIYNDTLEQVDTMQYLYTVNKYNGSIINNEPHKHTELRWVSVCQLRHMTTSQAMKEVLKHI